MSKQFDLEAFKAFCRSKGDEPYRGSDYNACALAQFGFPGVAETVDAEQQGISRDVYYSAVYSSRENGYGEKPEGWSTFSALADRLSRLSEQVQP